MLKEKLIIDIFIYIWCRTNNFKKKNPHHFNQNIAD